MTPDGELLRQYAEAGSEAAFAELVRRHIDLVYSVALREANGDAPLAEDATQLVFIDLARKARVLMARETLAGWLHTSARFAASKAIRGEQRRRHREQESLAMHENTAAEIQWEHLRPLLDEGVGQLKAEDRDAIVLRFYQGRSHQEIGAILGLSENSANKRIERALEKLHGYFTSRGVKASSALLAAVITTNSVQAAPTALAANVTTASLANASAQIAGSAFLAIIGGLIMNTKTKIAAAAVILVLLAGILAVKFWPADGSLAVPVASDPAPAKATALPTRVAPAAVVAPAAPPVPVAASVPAAPTPAVSTAANDPRVEINSAMNDFVGLLQSGNYAVAIETYMQIPPNVSGQQVVESFQQNPDFPKTIQMMVNATTAAQTSPPTYDDTGDLVTYKLSTPTDGKTMVRWKRIDGKWFVDAFE